MHDLTTEFEARPAGPAHDTFVPLNDEAATAEIRVSELAARLIEAALGEELAYVEFGWDEACDGPTVRGYRTVDAWDLDPTGSNAEAGISYEAGSFADIEDAVDLLDRAEWPENVESVRDFGNSGRVFRIHSKPADTAAIVPELDDALERSLELRERTEVAAIAALRERIPLAITGVVLGQCLLHMFATFSSSFNGEGDVHDDELMNELDQYAEAIRYSPSKGALAAGLHFDEDRDALVLLRRP